MSDTEPLNQRYQVDRWNTKVSLEVYQRGILRRVRWFSDLQDAYLWVKEQTEQTREINWILRTFTAVCRDLDQRWNNGDNGTTIALGGSNRFYVQYEPEAMEASSSSSSSVDSDEDPATVGEQQTHID